MRVKFEQGVQPTVDQIREIANSICEKPDMGWNYNHETGKQEFVQTIRLQGEEGDYLYRVNLSWEMITILEIK